MCIAESRPTYNASTNSCSCEPIPGLGPAPFCGDTLCISEKEPVYNVSSSTCYCEWIPGLEQRDVVTPEPVAPQCNDMFCIDTKHPVYNSTSQKCECQWIPGMEPTPHKLCADTMCISEMEPIYNMTSGRCYCEWLPSFFQKKEEVAASSPIIPTPPPTAIPTPARRTCPLIRCIAEMTPVWNEEAQKCFCEWIPGLSPTPGPTPTPKPGGSLCKGIYCISEQHPVYNSASGKCECEWIPGLEPSPIASLSLPTPPIKTRPPHVCPMMACIAEKHPVYDPVTQNCSCYWIPGLEPASVTERSSDSDLELCKDTVCITLKHPVYDPVSKTCSCEIPDPFPTPLPTQSSKPKPPYWPCETLWCPQGQQVTYDSTSDTCSCKGSPIKGKRETTTTISPSPTHSITPYPPNSHCPDTVCEVVGTISVYNPTSETCHCDWIPGTEPSPTAPTETSTTTCITFPFPESSDSVDSIPACYGVTCPDPLETPMWYSDRNPHCVCKSTTSSTTATASVPTHTLMKASLDSIPACYYVPCPDPLETPTWHSDQIPHCVCKSTTSSTTATTSPTSPPSKTTMETITKGLTTTKPPNSTPLPMDCGHLMCIPEMRLVWDEETGECVCKWITGIGPGQM
ncbi:uncharacterized protein BP5553_00766 [Venustampulla echinocandica]|uniref:Uncharacterized protein n=1 Tax=Venustampulla echinocandica TaxID=2656787 RepID=A0A370TZ34_9HELO|nr:uncharacterized protein BP5553_00766 [Venustampulla echinocandica]RDL40787.1 hypothetical protein BP5553_00766 [Venustampulla echinocandica]